MVCQASMVHLGAHFANLCGLTTNNAVYEDENPKPHLTGFLLGNILLYVISIMILVDTI